MKKSLFVLLALIFVLPSFGFSKHEHVYFSIIYDNKTLVVTDKLLKANWWVEESFQKLTRGKTLYQRAADLVSVWAGGDQFAITLPEIWTIVKKIESDIFLPVNNGSVNFDPDRDELFWITGQKAGRELDVERLCMEILGSLNRREPAKITPVIYKVPPMNPDEILEGITLRGQYSTSFVDNAPRECNIALALEAFDGQVIKPGESISFNDIVGRRTRDRGFKTAKVIQDGEFVDGIGGGVCQASTTLFNAVLLSGLKILESHNHSIPIGYVPLGLDAMVSSQADLRFRNITEANIYIEAKFKDLGRRNFAVVKIYGTPREFIYKPRVVTTTLHQTVEVQGQIDPTGEEVVVDFGFPPRSTMTFLDIYNESGLVDTLLVRKSRYKEKPKVISYVQTSSQIPDF